MSEGEKFCLRSEGKKKKEACFLKSRKINRLSPHLQALWEYDLKCSWESEHHLEESSRARPRPGTSGSDTVFPSPEDHPAGHLGQECSGTEKQRRVCEKSMEDDREGIAGAARALGPALA